MLQILQKTDDIRTAADEAHKKFIEARKNASAKHEEFKSILSDIHVINKKKLGSNRPRKRRSSSNKSSSSNGNKNREEKERAEEIFDTFKHGGKNYLLKSLTFTKIQY